MDTKSKRFDKLSIIKFICIVLSLIFAVAGTYKTVAFVSYVNENDYADIAYDIVEDIFTGSVDGDRVTERFNREYANFVETALVKGTLYPSADSKSYERYTEKVKKAYAEGLIESMMRYSEIDTEYFIFYALDQGYITLDQISGHEKNGNSIFYYNDGIGQREWKSLDAFKNDTVYTFEKRYYYEVGHDEDTDDEDYEYYTTTYPPISGTDKNSKKFYSEPLGIGAYHEFLDSLDTESDRRLENKNGAVYNRSLLSFLSKEKIDGVKADAIVDIDASYFNGNYYCGIYSVKVNRNKISITHPDELFYAKYGTYDTAEADYIKWCKDLDKQLGDFKNVFYAVLDEDNDIFTTNYKTDSGKKITKDNVEKYFSKYSDHFVISDFSDDKWGTPFERMVFVTANSFKNSNPGGMGNFKLWVAYDGSLLSGHDSFNSLSEDRDMITEMMNNVAIKVSVCILGYLVCLIVLIFLSGRRSYDEELHMGSLDGIFTDLRIILDLGLAVLTVVGIVCMFDAFAFYDYYTRLIIPDGIKLVLYAAGGLISLIFTDLVLYIARHVKNGTLLKNIAIVRFISFLIRRHRERKENRPLSPEEYRNYKKKIMPVFIPVFVIANIFAFICILIASDYEANFSLLLPILVICDIFTVRFIFRYVTGITAIFSAIHKMRTGEENAYVKTKGMPASLKIYGEELNTVGEGLAIAVENATREQRTRTELITNVSHDLKTPLTSIINYVDLLSKRPIYDEEAQKYITVLGEKSEKLKKLIEDLVEASKASAGNVVVNIVRMSLHELISQVIGEYEDDLAAKSLSMVVEERDSLITVCADSKLTCRVLDNLMVNIKKYAMPGTRVYVRVFREDAYGCIEISNISEQQLNIPASELKERFVRGDESRHTEGSGLGLAIAEDFMTIQQGKLELSINGDMFTATVKFLISYQ